MVSHIISYESYIGKTDWALDVEKKPFNKGVWKCNEFVRDAILEQIGKDIAIKKNGVYTGHPNTLQMLDKNVSIPNLERISINQELLTNITYVICRKNTEEVGGNHCGIYYNGKVYHASQFKVENCTLDYFIKQGCGLYVCLKLIE
jgi:hypothetical protein